MGRLRLPSRWRCEWTPDTAWTTVAVALASSVDSTRLQWSLISLERVARLFVWRFALRRATAPPSTSVRAPRCSCCRRPCRSWCCCGCRASAAQRWRRAYWRTCSPCGPRRADAPVRARPGGGRRRRCGEASRMTLPPPLPVVPMASCRCRRRRGRTRRHTPCLPRRTRPCCAWPRGRSRRAFWRASPAQLPPSIRAWVRAAAAGSARGREKGEGPPLLLQLRREGREGMAGEAVRRRSPAVCARHIVAPFTSLVQDEPPLGKGAAEHRLSNDGNSSSVVAPRLRGGCLESAWRRRSLTTRCCR